MTTRVIYKARHAFFVWNFEYFLESGPIKITGGDSSIDILCVNNFSTIEVHNFLLC
jgi:hypothetical protein